MAGNTDWYRALLRGAAAKRTTSTLSIGPAWEPPVGVVAPAPAPAPAPPALAPETRPEPGTPPAPETPLTTNTQTTGGSPAPDVATLQPTPSAPEPTAPTLLLPPDDGYYLSPVAGAIVVAALERRYMDGAKLVVAHLHDPEFAADWRQICKELDARQPHIGVAALLAFQERVEMEVER